MYYNHEEPNLRTYPIDSPQAAARVVAVFALSDGNLTHEELEGMRRSGLETDLGLASGEFSAIVKDFCEDVLLTGEGRWTGAGMLESATYAAIFDEVQDPTLRRKALRHALAVVAADKQVSNGESDVLVEMTRHWRQFCGGARNG